MAGDREQIYQKSKLGGGVGFGKRPAIVVVDLQKGFTLPEATAGADMTVTVENVKKLTDEARKKNIKIYYTYVGYRKDGLDLGVFGHKATVLRDYTEGNWNCDLDERLDVREEDVVIEKHWPSAFFGTHLVSMLITTHIDTVILAGCTTAGCVYASALDSCSYGFRTIVTKEAVADRALETHNMFLWNMGQKYADIMDLDDVVKEIGKIENMEYDLLW